jgi:ABC-type uncharacterized transport system permease subunit
MYLNSEGRPIEFLSTLPFTFFVLDPPMTDGRGTFALAAITGANWKR